jgi:pyruvate dehydrogenase E1 component alpha subunit
MESVGALDSGFVVGVEAEADAVGERLREAIRGMPDPDPLGMFEHVYAEPHAQVVADRAAMSDYLATLEQR